MQNNNLLQAVSRALKLKDVQTKALIEVGGMPLSKSAVQDVLRTFNPERPRKSRICYDEHLLAFIDGLLDDNTEQVLSPQLLSELKRIKTAISSAEVWGFDSGLECFQRID